jgi:hypothetical protein
MRLTLFCKHSDVIAVLERELSYFKMQFEHERQRAEIAVDELLRTRAVVGPITQPTPREVQQQESLAERLLRDGEFMGSGGDTE